MTAWPGVLRLAEVAEVAEVAAWPRWPSGPGVLRLPSWPRWLRSGCAPERSACSRVGRPGRTEERQPMAVLRSLWPYLAGLASGSMFGLILWPVRSRLAAGRGGRLRSAPAWRVAFLV